MINRVCKSNWTWRIPREESIPFGGPFYEAKIVFSIDNIIKIITHCQPKFWRLKKINFVSCDQHFLFLEKAVSNDHLCDHGKSEISSELSLLSFWISWFYHGGFFYFFLKMLRIPCYGFLASPITSKSLNFFLVMHWKRLCYFSFLHFYHCFIWPNIIFLLI
jgi:hypothetical protein